MKNESREEIEDIAHDEVIDIIENEYEGWKKYREYSPNSEERLSANYKDWVKKINQPKSITQGSQPDPNYIISDYTKKLLGQSCLALNRVTNGLVTSISTKGKKQHGLIEQAGFSTSDAARESAISREIRVNESLLKSIDKNLSREVPDKDLFSKETHKFANSIRNLKEISNQENLRPETKAKILMHLGDSYKRTHRVNKIASKKLGSSSSKSLSALLTAMKDMIDTIKSSVSRKFSSPSP